MSSFISHLVGAEKLSIHLSRGVIRHFKQRSLSWFSAGLLFMASTVVSGGLSMACVIVVIVRVSSLVINGNFPRYPVASYLRVLSLLASSLLWVQLSFAFQGDSSGPSFSAGVCLIMVAADILNTMYAAQEL